MRIFIITVLLITAGVSYGDNIDDLLTHGKLAEARNSIASTYGRKTEAPEYLFWQGLTTFSGESSAAHLKDFINRSTDDTYVPDWARLMCLFLNHDSK